MRATRHHELKELTDGMKKELYAKLAEEEEKEEEEPGEEPAEPDGE